MRVSLKTIIYSFTRLNGKWTDALGMLRGHYKSLLLALRFGEPSIRRCLREQLGILRQDCLDALGDYPTMVSLRCVSYSVIYLRGMTICRWEKLGYRLI